MSRLTTRDNDGTFTFKDHVSVSELCEKLARYEDIGVNADEIGTEIRAAYASGYADGIKDGRKVPESKTTLNGTYVDIDSYKRLQIQLAESQRREQAAISDMQYIHCAGRYGCIICLNNDVCHRQSSHIGKCVDFDWRGPQDAGDRQ